MKIAGLTIIYNEATLVPGCIESLKPIVDKHLFMVSAKPYFKNDFPQDNTIELIESLGGEVIEGYWSLEHKQRNEGIAMLQDYDWIVCTDADMWLEQSEALKLRDYLSVTKCDALVSPQISYWHDTDHVLVGDDFQPMIAVKPSVRFAEKACVPCPYDVAPIITHHINWCAPKDIYKKVMTYSHSDEFDGDAWYKQYYLGWKEGQKAVLPNKRFDVALQSLPVELKSYL